MQNFRNYHILNGYFDHRYRTYNGGTDSYNGWDWGVVELEAQGLDTVNFEKSLLLH